MPELRPSLGVGMLSLQSRIVDENGKPTLEFHRMIERLVAMNADDGILAATIRGADRTGDYDAIRTQIESLTQGVNEAIAGSMAAKNAANDAAALILANAREQYILSPRGHLGTVESLAKVVNCFR